MARPPRAQAGDKGRRLAPGNEQFSPDGIDSSEDGRERLGASTEAAGSWTRAGPDRLITGDRGTRDGALALIARTTETLGSLATLSAEAALHHAVDPALPRAMGVGITDVPGAGGPTGWRPNLAADFVLGHADAVESVRRILRGRLLGARMSADEAERGSYEMLGEVWEGAALVAECDNSLLAKLTRQVAWRGRMRQRRLERGRVRLSGWEFAAEPIARRTGHERQLQIRECLDRLDEPLRILLRLRFESALSRRSCAAELGCSVRTVEMAEARLRASLLDALG